MIRYGQAAARRGKTSVRLVYNWHNIESEAMRRFGDTVSSGAKRWYARLTASKLAALERDILKTAFGHVVCSAPGTAGAAAHSAAARIAVIENGVDVAELLGHARMRLRRLSKLVFVGLMDYSPERRGSDFFCPAHLACSSASASRS